MLLAGADDGQVHLVSVAGRVVLAVLHLGSPVLAACWVTSTVAVVGLADGRLEVVDAQVRLGCRWFKVHVCSASVN